MRRNWVVLGGVVIAAAIICAAAVAAISTIVLRGVDSANRAPFRLHRAVDVHWSCGGCAESNFIFETSQQPGVVNALNHTHGTSYLPAGRYSGVSIVATGNWAIRMSPSIRRPVRSSYTLRGVDSQNVKPFTVTHGSKVTWSCAGCASSNFIFETNQQPGVVNALDHTHGTSYLPAGRYSGVSVTANGYWTIVLK